MHKLLYPTAVKRILFFLITDSFLSLVSFYFAYLLRFNFDIPTRFLEPFVTIFFILLFFKIFALSFFKTYNIIWRFFGFTEAKSIVKAHISSYLLFALTLFIFSDLLSPFPRSVIVIDFLLSLVLIGGLRVTKRFILEQSQLSTLKPTIILGVNNRTTTMIKSALDGELSYFPVAVFTVLKENEGAVNTYINNIKVYNLENLEEQLLTLNVTTAILTTELPQEELKVLFKRLSDAGITEVKRAKLLGSQHEKLEDLSIEDLLARHPKDLDTETIEAFIKGKKVLITGAGGSIGSEITAQCHHFGAASLTLVDNSEFNLYQIAERYPKARHALTSVSDKKRLNALFEEEDIDIVIHAAAYKHVPLCEENIDIAITNNVMGTKNIIDLSIKHHVKKLVIISTDKAVRPTNVMGTTKRIGELYAQNIDSKNTEIVAVRFGNVLGSSGSVIPKFKKQIEEGGPLTVTDKAMTRYFMLIPEACQLVLQAASIAKGNELFILDMGKPVKICDLAQQMIKLYGKENEVDIIFTGLRPGEKLYEELLMDESEKKTAYRSIFIASPTHYEITMLEKDLDKLFTCEDKLAQLKKIVPEFNHQI